MRYITFTDSNLNDAIQGPFPFSCFLSAFSSSERCLSAHMPEQSWYDPSTRVRSTLLQTGLTNL